MIIPDYLTHPVGFVPKHLVKAANAWRATAQPLADAARTGKTNYPIITFGGKRK
jgi:hypothetical protein